MGSSASEQRERRLERELDRVYNALEARLVRANERWCATSADDKERWAEVAQQLQRCLIDVAILRWGSGPRGAERWTDVLELDDVKRLRDEADLGGVLDVRHAVDAAIRNARR